MEYTFKNLKTGKIESHDMRISEYDSFKVDNPHLERYHETAPAFLYDAVGSSSGLDAKTDNTWKEVLAKVAEKHPASELAGKYGNTKSVKQVKTKQILDKHIKKQNNK
jgi:hypothetical protein